MAECKLQEATCDFVKVGEGCKASILASETAKHKKSAIVKHVDLLNDENTSLKATVSAQNEKIAAIDKSNQRLEAANLSLQSTLEKEREKIAGIQSTVEKQGKELTDMKQTIISLEKGMGNMKSLLLSKEKTEEKKDEPIPTISKAISHSGPPPPVNTNFSFTAFNDKGHRVRCVTFSSFPLAFFKFSFS